ncbi:MAG: hypothetical protein WC641_02255 [Patescibacteria group bacterium]
MTKIMFIDRDAVGVLQQWKESGCAEALELVGLEPFGSITRTLHLVTKHLPEVLVVGFHLGSEADGATLLDFLRRVGGYAGQTIDNSGADGSLFSAQGVWVDEVAYRTPEGLHAALENLELMPGIQRLKRPA